MDRECTEQIAGFLSKVKERFKPESTILFGSRARGDYLEESDYDIMIVAKSFRGIHFLERMELVYELWDDKRRLDVVCYTPEELEVKREQIGTARQACDEGVLL